LLVHDRSTGSDVEPTASGFSPIAHLASLEDFYVLSCYIDMCHDCQVDEGPQGHTLTIDQLAAATGTTTRRVRALQTMGLLPGPELRGRTGLYGPAHLARLNAVLRLQDQGFSLESLRVLFAALDAGRTLADVLGVDRPARPARRARTAESAELYWFPDLTTSSRPLLSLVPTTVWNEGAAS
jgi:DNA-binding transcriptional MerR regulator